LAHGHANGIDPAGVDRRRLRACRRARNEGLDALEPAARRRNPHLLANVPLFQEAQGQTQKLGPDTHRSFEWPPMRRHPVSETRACRDQPGSCCD
jgi:hypothetical protein